MATGYWRIKVVGGVFQLQDHTPNATAREDLLLKVNTPSRHTVAEEETLLDTSTGVDAAEEQAIVSDAGYTYVLAQPWGNPNRDYSVQSSLDNYQYVSGRSLSFSS